MSSSGLDHGFGFDNRDARPGQVDAAEVLPIVRAAMTRGEGPPAVVEWVRTFRADVPAWAEWTAADEQSARDLARRLAAILNDRGRADTGVGRAEQLAARGRANTGTEELRETLAAKSTPRGQGE